MDAIFDQRATLVAWLDNHSRIIFNLQNHPVAHVANGAVYTFRSEHLGYFDRGFFRDRSGKAVAFTRERGGGPLTVAPICFNSPAARRAPVPPTPPNAPPMPIANGWSLLEWDAFVACCEVTQI